MFFVCEVNEFQWCSLYRQLFKIFFCVPQKKESNTALERLLLNYLLVKLFIIYCLKASSHCIDKLVCWSLLDQCVIPVGVGWRWLEFVGSVCYPCWRWLALVGVGWSLLDQCVTPVGVGWRWLEFVGSVCYPRWRWLEFVGSVCYPCWRWLAFVFTRLNMLIDIGSSIFSQVSKSWSVSVGAVWTWQLFFITFKIQLPTSLLEFVCICLCGVNWPLSNSLHQFRMEWDPFFALDSICRLCRKYFTGSFQLRR